MTGTNHSSGVVLAFNVSAIKTAALLAKQHQITILSHKVIYKLLEELKVSACTRFTASLHCILGLSREKAPSSGGRRNHW